MSTNLSGSKRSAKKRIAFLLALMIAFSSIVVLVSADTSLEQDKNKYKSLESQLSEIKKSQSSLQSSIAKARNNKNDALELKTLLDNEISLIIDEIETVTELVGLYNQRVDDITAEIDQVSEQMYRSYLAFKERIVLAYENGDDELIDFVLSAHDFSDFLSRVEYTSDLVEHDKNFISSLFEQKKSLDSKKLERELAAQKCSELVAECSEQQAALQEKRDYASALIEAYESDIVKYQLLEKEAERDFKEIQDLLKELEKQIKEKEQKLYAGGLMRWPLDKTYYITSEFGYRIHPVTGQKNSFHNGIDVGTDGDNVPVHACGDGTVVFAGVSPTYGNYVMINHGNDSKGRSIVTLYAHFLKYTVKKGQEVKAGTVIGYAGATGRATGVHLHLSVLLDGTPVDPGLYVNILPPRKK